MDDNNINLEEINIAQLAQAAQAAQESQDEEQRNKDVKIQMLALAKEILERNAALLWEQDKTRGLTITVDEIIVEAKKLLDFINE